MIDFDGRAADIEPRASARHPGMISLIVTVNKQATTLHLTHNEAVQLREELWAAMEKAKDRR